MLAARVEQKMAGFKKKHKRVAGHLSHDGADALAGCTEGSEEESELKSLVDLIEAKRSQALAARPGNPTLPVGKG